MPEGVVRASIDLPPLMDGSITAMSGMLHCLKGCLLFHQC